MKIRDIIIKIANREDVPKRIKWRNKIWLYDDKDQDYTNNGDYLLAYNFCNHRTLDFINDEVEIIEEEKEIEFEDIRELTQDAFDDWTEAKRINQLIKNQKKLIDVVNELRKEK